MVTEKSNGVATQAIAVVAFALADVVGREGMLVSAAFSGLYAKHPEYKAKIKQEYPMKPLKSIVRDFPDVLRNSDCGSLLFDGREKLVTDTSSSTKMHVANALADVVGTAGMLASAAVSELHTKHPELKVAELYPSKILKNITEDFPEILSCELSSVGVHLLFDRRNLAAAALVLPDKETAEREYQDAPTNKPAASPSLPTSLAHGDKKQIQGDKRGEKGSKLAESRKLMSRTVDYNHTNGRTVRERLSSAATTDSGVAAHLGHLGTLAPKLNYPAEIGRAVATHFYCDIASNSSSTRARPSATLFGTDEADRYEWSTLLGQTIEPNGGEPIRLNTKEPFCIVTVGVQGSGKSHATATIVEACLVPFPCPSHAPLVLLPEPMAVLAFHFGEGDDDISELIGLMTPSVAMRSAFAAELNSVAPRVKRVVKLVSPTYYLQQRKLSGDQEGLDVLPLLLNWQSLSASDIRTLMRLNDSENQQLYVSVLLDLLRQYQSDLKHPVFEDFVEEVKDLCKQAGQAGPLGQRLQILESLVFESERNQANSELTESYVNLKDCVAPGTLVIVDLTDPLMSGADASAIFQVLHEQFRQLSNCPSGKLCVLDEAHRYLSSGTPLAAGLVKGVRVMRHNGMRYAISTQSPLTLPPEILELSSAVLVHGFHSHVWYSCLSKNIPFPHDGFSIIQQLDPGEALVFARRMQGLEGGHRIATAGTDADTQDAVQRAREGYVAVKSGFHTVRVRQRITLDLGASQISSVSATC
uniref:Uncharacterized protein n=1 Tax=Mantoniella antarctica TaxID=81844 RepID=A0A7S0X3J6_9CHLO|mmetsp:Transcript_14043/g.33969  ORF Transcript_14043/g.33969 Transcript_14043/m.33969 type:complete len:756 (+) Transcript_14043:193-2460(+)